jgi:hypothetical protein
MWFWCAAHSGLSEKTDWATLMQVFMADMVDVV